MTLSRILPVDLFVIVGLVIQASLQTTFAAEGDQGVGAVPLLLQKPTISASNVVFTYAGDLWLVGRTGGEARRLTAGVGLESYPAFSPDGATVAFAADYEGNIDVYTVPVAGGVPKRLTHHPDSDVPVGFSADGQQILFRSSRNSYAWFLRLFTVSIAGGQPTEVPLPMAENGSFSHDGKRIAYVPL